MTLIWAQEKNFFLEQRVFNNNNNNNNNNNKNVEELVGQLYVLSKCLKLPLKTNKKKGDNSKDLTDT